MAQDDSSNAVNMPVMNIAVTGNPNTGKSSLFNRLTGMRQRVGNYPGITVEKKAGVATIGRELYNFVDLPGTYSLSAASPDEAVVIEYLLGHLRGEEKPDLVLYVVDSTALVRSLFMAAQIADIGLPMVLALNMSDEARKCGAEIDAHLLGQRLGVPCVAVSAKTGEGVERLRSVIAESAHGGPCMNAPCWPQAVLESTSCVRRELGAAARELPDPVMRRLLFDSSGVLAAHLGIEETVRKGAVDKARALLFEGGFNPMACEAMLHYRDLRAWTSGVNLCRESGATDMPCAGGDEALRAEASRGRGYWNRRHGGGRHGGGFRGAGRGGRYRAEGGQARFSESIDKLLLHRGWGMIVFVAVMYLVFQAVYSWAGPFMDLIDGIVGGAQGIVGGWLSGSPIVESLVVDGVIGGIGACLIFLPQILILFMFVALLEDSGYLPRAAFLMDKVFSWCGLSGKSFVPMLSSYACAVPGIMAARTIKDSKARIATIMVAPLMSCSARLPVYVLFIGVFIQPRYGSFYAGLLLFAMHILGLLLAGPVAFIMTRFVLKSRPQPFLLELPPYRIPSLRDVGMRMYERGKVFMKTAGTVIFAMSIIIWALLYFPHSEELRSGVKEQFVQELASERGVSTSAAESIIETDSGLSHELARDIDSAQVEQSYLGRFGRFVQPVFEPAGFDWKVSVGIVSSFPAREVILSTLGVIYKIGDDVEESEERLGQIMVEETWESGPRAGQPVYTLPMVLALMVFFALCQQCMATLAAIVREAGFKWAVFSFAYMTSLAWLGAVVVFQLGSMF